MTCAVADAGEFTVQLCQQRDRTLDGLPGQMTIAAAASSEHCEQASDGVTLTPPAMGMAAGATGSVSLQTASGEAHIERAILWHDSEVDGNGLQLSLEATTGSQTTVLRSTAVGDGTLGGRDQAPIGPTSTGFDFSSAPVQRLRYVLRCAGPSSCAGGSGAARLRLYGAELTIGDPVAPALSVGAWPIAEVKGTFDVAYGAQDDESGVRQVRVYADGRSLASLEPICDSRLIRPCPQRLEGTFSVDTSPLRDDSYDFVVRTVDGAGNVTQSPPTPIYTANHRTDPDGVPFNERLPTIAVSGKLARPGERLTASPGTWTPTKLTYRYQWSQCSSRTMCTEVVGAQDSTYDVTSDDIGKSISVKVTAINVKGIAGEPASAVTAVVQASAVRNRLPPDVGGVLAAGKRVTASPGDWDGPGSLVFSYRWLVCAAAHCRAVTKRSKSPAYAVRAADRGRKLVVEVTARPATGASVTVRSAPVGPIGRGSAQARTLPRPFIRPVLDLVSSAGRSSYRLRAVSVGALRRGSIVDVACSTDCTTFEVHRTARNSRLALKVPSVELLPGARIVVRVRRRGFVGRIRRITLGRQRFSYSPMRCLQATTNREVACGSR